MSQEIKITEAIDFKVTFYDTVAEAPKFIVISEFTFGEAVEYVRGKLGLSEADIISVENGLYLNL